MRMVLLFLLGLVMIPGDVTAAERLAKFKAIDAASTAEIDHSAFGAFLKAYVRPQADGLNRVAYGEVTAADKAALAAYIGALEDVQPARLNRDEAFAYWVNLYNALTLKVVLERYPVSSIREIKSGPLSIGPWRRRLAKVDNEALSLDDIEHGILRAYFNDNRVHYAVNCASVGCPNLRAEPWRAAGLSGALDEAARAFVNSPRGATVFGGKATVSSIYDWYGKDFGQSETDILAHLSKYADPELKSALAGMKKITRYVYDWTLNEAK